MATKSLKYVSARFCSIPLSDTSVTVLPFVTSLSISYQWDSYGPPPNRDVGFGFSNTSSPFSPFSSIILIISLMRISDVSLILSNVWSILLSMSPFLPVYGGLYDNLVGPVNRQEPFVQNRWLDFNSSAGK